MENEEIKIWDLRTSILTSFSEIKQTPQRRNRGGVITSILTSFSEIKDKGMSEEEAWKVLPY